MSRKSKDYISVLELSEIVDKSPQWIYKLMQKSGPFNTYVKTIDGKKKLHKSVIWEFFGVEYEGHKPGDGAMKQTQPLDVVMSALLEQLRAKDEQIRMLHETINDLTDSLQAEQLLRSNSDRLLMEYKKAGDQEEPEAEQEAHDPEPQQTEPEPAPEVVEEPKTFIDKLFALFRG